MGAYLTVSVGPRPQEARPLFSSDDPRLVHLVMRELMRRVTPTPVLELVSACSTEEPGEPAAQDGGGE